MSSVLHRPPNANGIVPDGGWSACPGKVLLGAFTIGCFQEDAKKDAGRSWCELRWPVGDELEVSRRLTLDRPRAIGVS
jgi:hypothetical protein